MRATRRGDRRAPTCARRVTAVAGAQPRPRGRAPHGVASPTRAGPTTPPGCRRIRACASDHPTRRASHPRALTPPPRRETAACARAGPITPLRLRRIRACAPGRLARVTSQARLRIGASHGGGVSFAYADPATPDGERRIRPLAPDRSHLGARSSRVTERPPTTGELPLDPRHALRKRQTFALPRDSSGAAIGCTSRARRESRPPGVPISAGRRAARSGSCPRRRPRGS